MKRVVHLTYKKGGYEWREGDEYQHFDQVGEVLQDLNKQKAFHSWGIPEHRRFKIVVPDGNGQFTKVRYFRACLPNS